MSLPDLTPLFADAGIRGRMEPNRDLADVTWFRVGGPAQLLFSPADEADLAAFLEVLPRDVPVHVLGLASNTLVRDGGVPGVVIRLSARGFGRVDVAGTRITAGTALPDVRLARAAADAAIAGLAFYRGIPGALGGALRMNAGAYGTETKDVLVAARAVDRAGVVHVLTNADFGFAYRHSSLPADFVFTEATFQGTPGDREAILAEMEGITARREETQPVKSRTGGSTFKNPPGEKAWQLVDKAGCRGLTVGGAQMSELHANFMLNLGEATADDLERLGETVRGRVRETAGITLEWEIKRIGVPAGDAVPAFMGKGEAA
ncbi:UDP-N-acetylmuramate dehydrogenase [Acuticoccus sp. I52.16.1]|uniref:UDP-N-acetylmuramate dehydrogenase n=1 Tax=Acuticoccus sp. I52.16.1 TaxID=2928472 RepID=UPI001FD2972F|nr:UDP-N-acetylmuramate dehydrogenase [Acuticoccus sp. I52.16.1]UOM33614.1 UDP-N-acetylmuramate dehydrogenase [Acuticoccus sp. I52.16.1]